MIAGDPHVQGFPARSQIARSQLHDRDHRIKAASELNFEIKIFWRLRSVSLKTFLYVHVYVYVCARLPVAVSELTKDQGP